MVSFSFPFSYCYLISRFCGQTAVETPSENRVLGTTTEYGRRGMEMGWGSTGPSSGRGSGLERSVWIDLSWSGRVYDACYLC